MYLLGLCSALNVFKTFKSHLGFKILKEGVKETIAILKEFQGHFRRSKLPDNEKPNFSETLQVTRLNMDVSMKEIILLGLTIYVYITVAYFR